MTANEAFNDYMSSLPPRERIAKSRDLRNLGHIESWNLSDWRTGRVKISLQWQRKISVILGVDIFANIES